MGSGIVCPHALAEKFSEQFGEWKLRCDLIGKAVLPGVWVYEHRCRMCSQKDDGASIVSEHIVRHLKLRASKEWAVPKAETEGECKTCGKRYAVSVMEAVVALKERVGSVEAERVVDASTMPKDIKDSLKEIVNDAAATGSQGLGRENP